MPRYVRDSDEDTEPKTGRRSRVLLMPTVADSPVRRSSRIMQSAKQRKASPESPDSDVSSVSNSQPTKITRQRTGTMDSVAVEPLKSRRTRMTSISSDISEATDVDVDTIKRSKRSLATVGTPTKSNSRAFGKLTRASSESKSPPVVRITRRTRASSMEPEAMFEQSMSQPGTPIKMRKRASMLPLNSPVREEMEEKSDSSTIRDIPLIEIDECINSEKSNFSLDKSQQSEKIDIKRKSTNESKVERDDSKVEESSSSAKNQFDAHVTTDATSIHDISSSKNKTGHKLQLSHKEEKLIEIEEPLIQVYKKLPVRELGIRLENILDVSVKELKKQLCNKENRTSNIISDVSAEKSAGSTSNVMLGAKSLNTSMNKSLDEKEIKSAKSEPNLSKRYHSRDSTDGTMKCSTMSKEIEDNITEKIDTLKSSTPKVINERKSLEELGSSVNNTSKGQSPKHDENNDSNKTVLLQDDDVEIIETTIIEGVMSVKSISESNPNLSKTVDKPDKVDEADHVIDTKTTNKTALNETAEILCSSVNRFKTQKVSDEQESHLNSDNDNDMKLVYEQNAYSSEKEFDDFTNTVRPSSCHSDSPIDVEALTPEIHNEASAMINQQSSVSKNIARNNLPDSTDEIEEDLFKSKSVESSNVPETVEVAPNDKNANDTNSSAEVIQKPAVNALSKNQESKDTLVIRQKSTDVSSMTIEEGSSRLERSREDSEVAGIADCGSDDNIDNLFQDIPATKWKEGIVDKDDDTQENSVQIDVCPIEKPTNENEKPNSENECDLILVDKTAWLAAESMKAEKEKESFDYDSDDTVILKSRMDALKANDNAKKMDIIEEKLLMEVDSEEDEIVEHNKPQKLTTRRFAWKDNESFTRCEKDASTSSSTVKIQNKSVTDRDSNHSVSKLNKLSTRETRKRSSSVHDEGIEEDINESTRISQMNKKCGASLIHTFSKQTEQSMQDIPTNNFQMIDSDKVVDRTEAYMEKKQEKQSLNKSETHDKDTDGDTIKDEDKVSSSTKDEKDDNTFSKYSIEKKLKSTHVEPLMQLNMDSSDESDNIIIQAMDFNFKKKNKANYSTIAEAGSVLNVSSDSLSVDSSASLEDQLPSFLFASGNDDSNDSINSDIRREYNLSGSKQKHSDDDGPGDDCRTSESKSSDSDDHGSDLADFVVDDDEVENEEEEEEESDEEEEEKEENGEEKKEQDVEKTTKEKEMEKVNKNEQNVIEDENIIKQKVTTKKYEKTEQAKMPCTIEIKRKEDTKTKKSQVKEIEKKVLSSDSSLLLTSPEKLSSSISSKKRKLDVQESSKDTMKEDSTHLNEPEMIIKRKNNKRMHALMECSTPKFDSCKEKFVLIETPKTALESKDESSSDTDKAMQNSSLEEKKSTKDSISKESSKKLEYIDNEKMLLQKNLPADLQELIEKSSSLKPRFEIAELHKTMNIDTESPTIKYLRKEKLNESAPALVTLQKIETSQKEKKKHKKKTPLKEKINAVPAKVKVKDDEEVPSLVIPSNDNETQKSDQQKRKKLTKEISNENISDELLLQDSKETNVCKKKKKKEKKRDKLSHVAIAESNIEENISQTNEKKKKRKRKGEIELIEKNENVNEGDTFRENIHRDKIELVQYSKRKKKIDEPSLKFEIITTDNYSIMQKKAKRQKVMENNETLPEKSPEKKKRKKKNRKENAPMLQSPKLKSISSKESEKLCMTNIVLNTNESKNTAFAKARKEALEAIKCVTERIEHNKRLKKKKKQEETETKVQERDTKISGKRWKQEKNVEKQKIAAIPMSCGLKRLSDDVIESISDIPVREKKRRKISRNDEQNMPPRSMDRSSKFAESKIRGGDIIPLSSCGSTTQFAVVNMQKIKKQSLKAAPVSFRQRMLAKNKRQPISSYIMYLEKKRAMSHDGFSGNAF